MKPAPFEYHAPDSLEHALALMAEHGGDAKLLAGGQSLIPAMNFRVAQPAMLVDLNGLSELDYIRRDSGGLLIGAMTRQRAVERSKDVAKADPLLYETMPYIAHPQIRTRGTMGGSLAHAGLEADEQDQNEVDEEAPLPGGDVLDCQEAPVQEDERRHRAQHTAQGAGRADQRGVGAVHHGRAAPAHS
jgi:hypothetical protein